MERVLERLERERRERLARASGIPYPEDELRPAAVAPDNQNAHEALPGLVDCKGLQAELGVSRAAAEAIMRQLDTVQIDGLRKVYVRRRDVAEYLEARTFTKDRVAT